MTWKLYSHSLRDTDLLTEESLFFLGNGYLGVRGNFEEGYGPSYPSIRGTYINAFHDIIDVAYGEKLYGFPDTQQKMLNVIDSQTILLFFGEENEKFAITEGEVLDYSRTLHFDKGYSERHIHWLSPGGREVKITFQRMVSFIHRELFMQKVTVEPINFEEKVTIVSNMNGDVSNYVNPEDPRVAQGHSKQLNVKEIDSEEQNGFILSETETSQLETALFTRHSLPEYPDLKPVIEEGDHQIEFFYTVDGERNKPIEMIKLNIHLDTLRHGPHLKDIASGISTRLKDVSYDALMHSQEEYMHRFWERSDVEIDGEDKIQEGIRFNLYHLLQSSGRDKYSNIPAKGLSGEGYEGHYFWDTEIYMFPVFLMTNPELAKQLLIYRYSILEDAKDWAKTMGHEKGALFPWRTITGKECSSYFLAGSAQYHISADIAYSYIQFYHATHDLQFMVDYGMEVLAETARLWMDVGHFRKDGKFVIENVTGPDEYTTMVNNNYYTNAMAKHNLNWAVKFFDKLPSWDLRAADQLMTRLELGSEEVEDWQRASENMFLAYDQELDINPQDDSFLQKEIWDFENTPKENHPLLLHYHPLALYRHQVCKQADTVLAHFLLEDNEDMETIENSYRYYESITTHDSSLSSAVFSIMASKLGDMEKAYEYFTETSRLDLDNTKGNTKDGLHLANMGGTWMGIVFGFAGLRIKEDGLHIKPQLPEQWNRYSFHLQYFHHGIRVEVVRDEIRLELQEGEKVEIFVNGKSCTLKKDKEVKIPLKD